MDLFNYLLRKARICYEDFFEIDVYENLTKI